MRDLTPDRRLNIIVLQGISGNIVRCKLGPRDKQVLTILYAVLFGLPDLAHDSRLFLIDPDSSMLYAKTVKKVGIHLAFKHIFQFASETN